jgi:hypothetical protein
LGLLAVSCDAWAGCGRLNPEKNSEKSQIFLFCQLIPANHSTLKLEHEEDLVAATSPDDVFVGKCLTR